MSRLVIGIQPVREAVRAHRQDVERVLVAERSSGKDSRTLDGIASFAEASSIPVERVARKQLDRLSRGANHQGVAAYAPELRLHRLPELLAARPTLLTLLDRITDPQNFGAVIRSSVAFGSRGIIFPEHDAAPLTPATFRASAGAVEHAVLCRVRALPAAIQLLRAEGVLVVGLAGEASEALDSLDLTGPTAIVVGAEGSGLRKSVRAACETLARLPTAPPLDTLNASVSAGIALYEARRQQRDARPPAGDGQP